MNMVKRSALPKDIKPRPILRGNGMQITNGVMKPTECFVLNMVAFPEFSPNRHIRSVTCFVHDQPNLRCNLTLGRDTLTSMGVKINFKEAQTTWIDKVVPFHPVEWHTDKEAIRNVLAIKPNAVKKAEEHEPHMADIIVAKCDKADLKTESNNRLT